MEAKEIQKDLLMLLPHFNYRIIRPVKQLLDDGVSLEMYYCLQILRANDAMTMTKFSQMVNMPKHQLSKMSNRLFEQNFIERIDDSADRRITKIKITDTAIDYMDKFRSDNTDCYHEFMDYLEPDELNRFGEAVRTILDLFCKVSTQERNQ